MTEARGSITLVEKSSSATHAYVRSWGINLLILNAKLSKAKSCEKPRMPVAGSPVSDILSSVINLRGIEAMYFFNLGMPYFPEKMASVHSSSPKFFAFLVFQRMCGVAFAFIGYSSQLKSGNNDGVMYLSMYTRLNV